MIKIDDAKLPWNRCRNDIKAAEDSQQIHPMAAAGITCHDESDDKEENEMYSMIIHRRRPTSISSRKAKRRSHPKKLDFCYSSGEEEDDDNANNGGTNYNDDKDPFHKQKQPRRHPVWKRKAVTKDRKPPARKSMKQHRTLSLWKNRN